MKRLLALAILSISAALAQPTPKYPASSPTWDDLFRAANNAVTSLAANVISTDTTITVQDGSVIVTPGIVTIGNPASDGRCTASQPCEHVSICSKATNVLTVCSGGRGFGGTTATSHSSGALVRMFIMAEHHERVASEVISIAQSIPTPSTIVRGNALSTAGRVAYIVSQNTLGSHGNFAWDEVGSKLNVIGTGWFRGPSNGATATVLELGSSTEGNPLMKVIASDSAGVYTDLLKFRSGRDTMDFSVSRNAPGQPDNDFVFFQVFSLDGGGSYIGLYGNPTLNKDARYNSCSKYTPTGGGEGCWYFGTYSDRTFAFKDQSQNIRFYMSPDQIHHSIGSREDGYTLTVKDGATSTLSSVTFTGTGPNDLTVSGEHVRNTYTSYCVQIDGTGTPNTFRWGEDNCATWRATAVAITGLEQSLSWGVKVTFASTAGHALNDKWTWVGTPGGVTTLVVRSGQSQFYGGDPYSPYTAYPLLELFNMNNERAFAVGVDSTVQGQGNGYMLFESGALGTLNQTKVWMSANQYFAGQKGVGLTKSAALWFSDTDEEGSGASARSRSGIRHSQNGVLALYRAENIPDSTPATVLDKMFFSINDPNQKISFGGTTSSFPSLKRNGALLDARLADDSAFTRLRGAAPDGVDQYVPYGGAAAPADGCAQFATGKLTSTGVACGAGGGAGDVYKNVTDGSSTATASGSLDTLRFRSSDGSVNISVVNNDATYGDNVNLTTPKSAHAQTFTASTTWSLSAATHGLGTCDLVVEIWVDDGAGQRQVTNGWSNLRCEPDAGAGQYDVTVTWPTATAGQLVLVRSGGSGGGGGGGGLADPAANGIVVRTALNTTTARTITGTAGKVTVTNGDGVSGNPAITIGADVADKTQSATWTAGARQRFQSSSSTPGAGLVCAALPSTPSAGDLACDSADSNKIKQYNGTQWVDLTATGSGHTIADEGTALTARPTLNFTGSGVSCTDNAGSNRTDCSVTGGGGGSFDSAATYDLTGNNKVNGLYFTHYLTNSSGGTTLYKLACVQSDGTVADCTTANASRTVGICMSGCGTTGSARVAFLGRLTCQFDGPVTAGNWVGVSSSAAGKCTDAGTTRPATALGIVIQTGAAAGNYDLVKGAL